MVGWILKAFPRFSDHDFFEPAFLKLLNTAGSGTSPNDVYEALFNHFGKSVFRFEQALNDAAVNNRFHNHEASRACVRWLISRQNVNLELNGGNHV